jgi:hypothetical protein
MASFVTVDRFWAKRFSLNGAGAAFDLNVASGDFRVVVPTGQTVAISRVLLEYTMVGMRYDRFAGLGAALTNGIEVKAYDKADTELVDFLDGGVIKTNADWALLAGVDGAISAAAGPDLVPVRWSLFKAGSQIRFTEGQYIEIKIQDNLSTLASFTAAAQGVLYPNA